MISLVPTWKRTRVRVFTARGASGNSSNVLSTSVDDTSVPPVEQEIHEEFFAAGEKDHPLPRAESGPYSALDLRHAQKMTLNVS